MFAHLDSFFEWYKTTVLEIASSLSIVQGHFYFAGSFFTMQKADKFS